MVPSEKTFLFLLTAGPFNQRCSNHWQGTALASSKHGLHPSYLIIFSSCVTMLLSCSSTKLQGSERHREECVSLLVFDLSLLLFAMLSEGNCKSPILGDRIIESFRCDEISKVTLRDELQTEGQGENTLLLGAKKWDECDHKTAAGKRKGISNAIRVSKGRRSSETCIKWKWQSGPCPKARDSPPPQPSHPAAFPTPPPQPDEWPAVGSSWISPP